MDPCGLGEVPPQELHEMRTEFPVSLVGICVYDAKGKAGKSAGTLAWVKAIAPNLLVGILSSLPNTHNKNNKRGSFTYKYLQYGTKKFHLYEISMC